MNETNNDEIRHVDGGRGGLAVATVLPPPPPPWRPGDLAAGGGAKPQLLIGLIIMY